MPRGYPNRENDTRAAQVGQPQEIGITLEGDAELERSSIEVIDGPLAMNRAEMLAFNEEFLEILVHDSTDENADPIVTVGVNGIQIAIPRNERVRVRRKFVERLGRAKRTAFKQNLGNMVDPQAYNKLHAATALQYPFSVMRDDNPVGGAWLQALLAEAA